MSASRDRALGAFYGLALGDALGMPTQSMCRKHIVEDYGQLRGFVDAGPRQFIAHRMPAGSITDDTEQAIMLAQLIIDGSGVVDPPAFAHALIAWEARMKARGSLDLLGPSTKRAVERILDGSDPTEAGRFGSTNGAAMRITPAAIAASLDGGMSSFVDAIYRCSFVTHNTSLGIASAAAVAGAISAGIAGADLPEAVDIGVAAAAEGATRGYWVAGGDIATRIEWAVQLVGTTTDEHITDTVAEIIGTSVASQESVVAAFALAVAYDDPWDVVLTAATIGGDTDTIAAIAGAVRGAVGGLAAWPGEAIRTVIDVNSLDLEPLVDRLLALRNTN
ncbi:ADP-ribosylglycohydrolase family protein [Rhodococcus sp. IEGM 1330]|uniref:ADP-ribosylglycohydrolase family protein n=1 Tax=Rhodococcus sp. IEGM 1330 TaxID=3082225 RepID=UPI002953A304|nr:ADP-ribosylglycohydrolase family protein [Rhodococcus sp. IEGM 1330]MDV8023940.1 ADP-ribosylglycohydrolase family protein [Rhodococcus sp. IEGM 1330]